MEITIFKEVTTEGVIASIEENSKKYHDGLYADMNNLPERTMVKKGAAEIGDIIKELKASRIKITKANTAAVNKEHDAIVARLQAANKPFTDLLDAYNIERKKVLDAEKARKQAILDAAQYENDHEMGLLINKTFEYDRQQLIAKELDIEKQRAIEREEYAVQQVKIAEQRQVEQQLQDEANKRHEENARLANVEHVKLINNQALEQLAELCCLTQLQAKAVVTAIAQKKVSNITINY